MLSEHLDVIRDIDRELTRACSIHPNWPSDIVHASAIVAEEAGELVKAALDHAYFDASFADIEKEAIHTAATCIRLLAEVRRRRANG